MKRPFLLALFFVLLSQANLFGQTKDWTLLVYVVGTDIVEDAIADIDEMKAAGNTDNVHIVGLLGGANLAGWEKPAASTFVDGVEIPLDDYTPNDSFMVSVSNLTQFINYGVSNYPADKYMLAFYNHGMAIRGWGWDETTDSQFSIGDLKEAIEQSDYIVDGNKFDLLAFDACEMACIEAQAALQDLGEYYIASEEEEPGHAWNWTPIVSAMNNNVDLTVPELGTTIIDSYMQHSIDNETHAVTLSLIDLTKVAPLVSSLETVVGALDDDEYLNSLIRARAKSEEYAKNVSMPSSSEDVVDIGDLIKNLKVEEPGISGLLDNATAALNDAVLYQRSDDARPKATGISMFMPLNLFTNEDDLNNIIVNYYNDFPFSNSIKSFVSEDYVNFALSDDDPVSGSIDNSLGFTGGNGSQRMATRFSSIRINDHAQSDLHQLQVVLLEEIAGNPDEFIVLGSTVADTIVNNPDGSAVYGYEWDEEWLSLNGYPAYVADIQSFEVLDANGGIQRAFTRIHIPAILNPNTAEEKSIMLDYVFDDSFNFTLEGIDRESYVSGSGFVVTAKERITLKPSDQVQLLYEIFDAETNEARFVPEPGALIQIQTDDSDLVLGHSQLPIGRYHVGFVLMDHAHNDTVIYDPVIREIQTSSIGAGPIASERLFLHPNPSSSLLTVRLNKPSDAVFRVYNQLGNVLLEETMPASPEATLNVSSLHPGAYLLDVQVGDHILTQRFLKH